MIMISFLYKIIELIEKFEYRKIALNENDINKKIVSSSEINLNVSSDKGIVNAIEIHKTQPYTIYDIQCENGYKLSCADLHILYTLDLKPIFVSDLKKGDFIFTDIGYIRIKKIKKHTSKISMFDLSINDKDHRYYTNNILSHNTINSAITILYYCIFERNKNILIAGNIAKTAQEILSKIKDIYTLLPFWLKPSVLVWNVSMVTFDDTKCKIKTTSTTKTAAIGNTIDFLFLDEFAHVENSVAYDFYRSIYPTVASIKNSKIVITSTPNGYNLFYELLTSAELPDGDEMKNTFHAKRVYWYQVEGRFVVYLRLNDKKIKSYNLDNEFIYDYIISLGFPEQVLQENGKIKSIGVKIIKNISNGKYEIHVPNKESVIPGYIQKIINTYDSENKLSDYFRSVIIEIDDKKIRLLDLCDISSWREDNIKDIGSVEAFNQEYDLQFLSGSKMILDYTTMSKIENNLIPFIHIPIEKIESKTFIDYSKLLFINDTVFNIHNIKNYHLCLSVDISEGLNGDYSVINFFRIIVKDEEDWSINYESIYDFFKLEQVGIFHSNTTSVQDLGELLYLICFELCDDNKIGVLFENNRYGTELTNKMLEMYKGRNRYSPHIFFRFKHKVDDLKYNVGIKVTHGNKDLLVKEYQKRLRQSDIIIHHQQTLTEITKFIKKDTANGYTFSADSGAKDDIVMTIVEISNIFDNSKFKYLCDNIFNTLDVTIKTKINDALKLSNTKTFSDYSIIGDAKQKMLMRKSMQSNQNTGLLGSLLKL